MDRRRVPLVLVFPPLLALALGCTSGYLTPAPRRPPDALETRVPEVELRALLLLLADRQVLEPFTLDRALEGPPEIRELLAVTLGRVGDRRALPVLRGLLVDPEPEVRRAAAFALGELEDPGAETILLRAAVGADRETATLAVEALAKVGAAVAEVGQALAELPEGESQARLLPHLFRFREEARVPLAELGLAHPDPRLHARAAYALARDPFPVAAPALRRLLADPDPWVRGWAARALGEVGTGEDVARFEPLLADPAPGPIVHALRAARRLVEAGAAAPPASWRGRLLELFDDPRPGVRLTALEAATAWLADDVEGELGAVLRARAGSSSGTPGREREVALLALASARHPGAGELAAAAALASEPSLRAVAATAAALLVPGDGAPELLERLAADPAPGVRAAALEARLAAAPQGLEDPLFEALADPDPAVRATALQWLGEHPILPMEVLQGSVAAARRDTLPDARLAGVAALAARAAAEPLERGGIILLLEELAADRDDLTRRAAIGALGTLGRPTPPLGAVETDRDVAAYEQIVRRTARPREVEIHTRHGVLTLRLDCPRAPLTCLSFLQLAGQGFYDGLTFHRVVPDFVVQGGDPRGDGRGGPGYRIRDEINRLRYRRGVVGMALSGPDTGGSQFFITLSEQPHLDGGYTAFGEVVGGEEVLDRLIQGDVMERVVVR